MVTKNEDKKMNDLDKKVSLLQNDFGYMKNDISEVKGDMKGLRSDFKELTGVIASLGFVTQEDFEAYKKEVKEDLKNNYVTKSTFQKLESKLTPILWLGGIAAAAIVTSVVGAIVVFVLNGGLAK